MRGNSLTGGGSLLSLGMVWTQVVNVKATQNQGQVAFAAAPAPHSPRRSARSFKSARTSSNREPCVSGEAREGHRPARRPRPTSQLIFIGTGSSTAVPSAFHLLRPELDSRQSAIAQLSVATPPEVNKNYRGNTSVVVRVVKDEDGNNPDREAHGESYVGAAEQQQAQRSQRVQHIQIDTGKTWREGVIRWFPRHNIRDVDGIVLTHDHADAILGLDDVRGLQDIQRTAPTPVHVSAKTDRSIRRVFPYLVGRENDNGANGRFVASLSFNVFRDFESFEVGDLEITPFPVLHGEDYVSHGFIFGPEGNKVCYISDLSRVPEDTLAFLQRQGPIQLLVCDALMRTAKHPTHFCVEDSVELAKKLQAQRTLLVGLGSDIEYHATNALLAIKEKELGAPHVRLAHDGLAVDVDLH